MSPFYTEGDRKLDSVSLRFSPTNVRLDMSRQIDDYWLLTCPDWDFRSTSIDISKIMATAKSINCQVPLRK